jgi:hypothetical protein
VRDQNYPGAPVQRVDAIGRTYVVFPELPPETDESEEEASALPRVILD